MNRSSGTAPCLGYPVRLLYPDVGPEELAREEAREQEMASWPAYLQRMLTPGAHRSAARQVLTASRDSAHQP